MAYFDSLYGKSSNSAPTPTISSSSGGGGYFGSLFSSKPTQTKVTTTRPTVSTTQPVKIAPNSTNIFDTIKQDVQKAITIGKNTIVSFVTPKVQPQAPKPVQAPPKTVTILPNQKKLDQNQLQTLMPSFVNSQPTSAQMKTTPQSMASAAKTVEVNKKITSTIDKVLADTFPGTQKALSDLKIDPLSLKSDPHKVLGDVFNSFKEPLMAEKDRIISYFQAYQHPTSETEKLGKRIQVVTGGANVLFSPISALFSAANDIPILGTVTKIISLPFTAVGETATKTSDTIIDALPIPKEAKAQIKPGVGEMFALAAQIALGKALDISASKRNELVSKYGVEDTKTILDQAQKLAQEKKGIQEFTPQDVIDKVMQNNLDQTPEGKTLIKSAIEAKKNGQNILISSNEKPSKVVYSGRPIGETGSNSKTSFFTDNQELAGKYAELNKKVTGTSEVVSKDIGGMNLKEVPKAQMLDAVDNPKIRQQYDGIKFKDEQGNMNYALFEKSKTVSTAKVEVKPISNAGLYDITKVIPSTEVKTPSKIAVSIERKAIEQGLTKGFENIAGYDKITIKDQAAKAENLMSNLDQAGKVIRGEEPLPTGLRGTSLVVAAEQYIKKTGDAQMAYDLANSPLVSGTSAAAQELAMAAQREPDSLALKLQDLKKARETALQKRTGKTVDKAVKLEVDKIKTEIVKKAPNKYDWGEFIKTIQC